MVYSSANVTSEVPPVQAWIECKFPEAVSSIEHRKHLKRLIVNAITTSRRFAKVVANNIYKKLAAEEKVQLYVHIHMSTPKYCGVFSSDITSTTHDRKKTPLHPELETPSEILEPHHNRDSPSETQRILHK
ncbi:hypothetical protein TNCV_1770151 [Trichonephila clavipes]|nr:hypothetical protein TNCV_1770151 [Trichonephila clavipes]